MEHVVQRGETLSAIAGFYGLTVAAIAQANRLINPNFVYAGQRLVIPALPPATRPRTVTPPTNSNQPASNETTDAVMLAALAAAKKKKEQEQLQQYLMFGGVAVLAFVLLSRK
jgi:LysM repeat protein